jgi:hypothetical protein
MSEDAKSGSTEGEARKTASDTRLIDVNVDLKGIGEAAPHLKNAYNNTLKAISRGLGVLYPPIGRVLEAWSDKKVAEIHAAALIDLAKKRAELMGVLKTLRPELPETSLIEARAMNRLIEDAVQKQVNREAVATMFLSDFSQGLPHRDAASAIDDDWLVKFWSLAELVGNDDLRSFFGRLLAREVSTPGTISPITLSVVSTLTGDVAKTFQHFCRLSIDIDEQIFVIHPFVYHFQRIGPLDDFGVSYQDLLDLEAFGLIRSSETVMLNFKKNIESVAVNYAGQKALLNLSGLQLNQLILSRAGMDIQRVLPLSPIQKYTEILKEKLGASFLFDPETTS